MASRFPLHLPNVIFKMVRSSGLAPNEVAFHVPQNVNKLDIHQYLTKIYNVDITEVRTMNYLGRRKITPRGEVERGGKFKKAVVVLGHGHSFSFPDPPPQDELAKIANLQPRQPGQRGKNTMKKLFVNRKDATPPPAGEETGINADKASS